VKILLDENFPLQLYYRLRSAGYEVEHIILLGHRGIPDSAIRERVARENLLFLTQDSEFESVPADYPGTIIVSYVRQSLPIRKRTEIWFAAIERFMCSKPPGPLFELLESGDLVAVEIHDVENQGRRE